MTMDGMGQRSRSRFQVLKFRSRLSYGSNRGIDDNWLNATRNKHCSFCEMLSAEKRRFLPFLNFAYCFFFHLHLTPQNDIFPNEETCAPWYPSLPCHMQKTNVVLPCRGWFLSGVHDIEKTYPFSLIFPLEFCVFYILYYTTLRNSVFFTILLFCFVLVGGSTPKTSKTQTVSWWFKVTFLRWLSDPFQRLSDLQLEDQKVTLNHLVLCFFVPVFFFQLHPPTSSVSFSRPHGTQAQKGRNNKKQILAPGALRPDAARQAEISPRGKWDRAGLNWFRWVWGSCCEDFCQP